MTPPVLLPCVAGINSRVRVVDSVLVEGLRRNLRSTSSLESSNPFAIGLGVISQRKLRAYWPVLLWMCLIFLISTDLGSSSNSGRFIGPLVRWIYPTATEQDIRLVQAVVRKSGHLVEYAILALLIWRGRCIEAQQWRRWTWLEFWTVVLVCAVYAASDEWHQSFVPTRQGSPYDVLIDTVGVMLGLASIQLWYARKRETARPTPAPPH